VEIFTPYRMKSGDNEKEHIMIRITDLEMEFYCKTIDLTLQVRSTTAGTMWYRAKGCYGGWQPWRQCCKGGHGVGSSIVLKDLKGFCKTSRQWARQYLRNELSMLAM